MAQLSKNSKLYKELDETLKKVERKLRNIKLKDPDVDVSDFGFDKRMLNLPEEMTRQSAKQQLNTLNEFLSRKYHMKNLGTTIEGGKEVPVYMPSTVFKSAVEEIKAENRFRKKVAKAIESVGGYSYYRQVDDKLIKEKSNIYNATVTKSSDFYGYRIFIRGRKSPIGEVGKGQYRDYIFTPERFKSEYTKMKGRAVDTTHTRIQNLEKNWLKGLADKTSTYFAKSIKKLLKEENIDAVDFLGLFYLSGVFDFDFIYSQIDEKLKREQIKSEIKAFRQDPKYKQFRDILDED